MKHIWLTGISVLLIQLTTLHAQTIRVSCPRFFDKDKNQKVACVEALFSQDNYHLTMAALPPSNGLAPGVVLERRRHYVTAAGSDGIPKHWLLDTSATLAVSTNSSWAAGGDLRWILPRGYDPTKFTGTTGEKKVAESGFLWLENHQETETLHASVMHRTVRQLYYFGEGSKSPNQKYVFAEDDTVGFVNFRYPFSDEFALSAEVGGSATSLPQIKDSDSVGANFPPGSLPALTAQPIFANFSVAAVSSVDSDNWERNKAGRPFAELPAQDDPHYTADLAFRMKTQASFTWNQSAGGSPSSYQQFVFSNDAGLDLNYRLRNMFSKEKHPFVYRQFCGNNNKRKQQCNFGNLETHALLILSHTGFGQQIPFYLEPTLGGTDMLSRVTLRGWDNYRFRGRDAALLQFQYGYTFFDPFGMYIFYDAGKVGASPADLSPLDFRQDAGLGLSVRLRKHIITQTYVAWGASGVRWNYNFAKSF